jgi:hypothetical protein
VLVVAIIGLIACFMLNPFPGPDQTLMSRLFYDGIRPLAVNLGESQDLGSLLGGESARTFRLLIGLVLGLALLAFAFRPVDFRGSHDNMPGGLVVGLAEVGAWYLSSNIPVATFDGNVSLGGFYEPWHMLADRTRAGRRRAVCWRRSPVSLSAR